MTFHVLTVLAATLAVGLPVAGQAPRKPRSVMMMGEARRPGDEDAATPQRSIVSRPVIPKRDAGESANPFAVPGENTVSMQEMESFLGLGDNLRDQDPYRKFWREQMVEPELDPLTGLTKADKAQLDRDLNEDETVISEDAFGPIGPGRRQRLAQMAGMTEEQAKALWPWDDPEPFKARDLNKALEILNNTALGESLQGTPEAELVGKIVPMDDRMKRVQMERTILSEAEVNFAAYASLGFPFPIRVGKIQDIPPDGVVVFNPQLLRADFGRNDWETCRIKYKWMNGNREVIRGEFDVDTYLNLPRPIAPVSHLWIVSDRDVMAYTCIGVDPPRSLSEARNQIFDEVVSSSSFLRPNLKLYGLRWAKLPNAKDVVYHPQVRVKLSYLMNDFGMSDALNDKPLNGYVPPHMKQDEDPAWKAEFMRMMTGMDKSKK